MLCCGLHCCYHAHCLQVFYDKSSKQSEQTAQENQQLLAEKNELKEKVQKVVQESLTLQVILTGKKISLYLNYSVNIACLVLATHHRRNYLRSRSSLTSNKERC